MFPEKCTDCRYHIKLTKDNIEQTKLKYNWSQETRRAFNIYMLHGSLSEILFCTQLGVIDSRRASTFCVNFQLEEKTNG